MVSFVIAWLILNVAAPLLAYGVAGVNGATLVQPVMSGWVNSIDASGESSTWNGVLPWVSLGIQILVVLGWVIHVFKDRVLGFARDYAASRI